MSETTRSSERGAMLIFVAITIAVLVALSAFVVDMGVKWFARVQAQNAADAGALAGAVALAYDDFTDVSSNGAAYKNAFYVAGANGISQATMGIHVDVDPLATWELPKPAICGTTVACVQVDVYADGTHGSSQLPTYFANVFGTRSQPIKATATGMAAAANTNNCLRPWMIPDKWQENGGDPMSFDPGIDVYIPPPTAPATTPVGTGYKVPDDVGTEVLLKPGKSSDAISPSDFYAVDIDPTCPGGGVGGSCYRSAIANCFMAPHTIGVNSLTTEPGDMKGPTVQGTKDLMDQDPDAMWVSTGPHTGYVVDQYGNKDPYSPRIVPISMFSPAYFTMLVRTSGKFDLPIVNMMGFFVEDVDNATGTVRGILVRVAGTLGPGGVTPGPGAAFLMVPILVR